ncbi:RIP metalloprotease RseP [Candidatus Uhrbacteria bacterium RIFOXYB2_FULL_57_15]|uniref:Zinc metalloprotease n=1 Tax=Candidatus Uhrbacteria bacterium RIFOXYB2_FULL_57_15 TaxID=1802422 RepID=A0A1F7W787_9BACT|nr:MAG: RIP metalloprotease RseP [Candidatus Uhrbacteria bacterium RIFOXYB2_FULL_57_15]OGM00010.1 MAG: RIP metalloprotease RseP [Candidatus Uhrbacteria bacterium RIFOXYC12_FULL_57_11]
MFWTIILFLAVLSLLVFAHEFGHFIVAKKSGMKVEEFGFGFPPRAFAIRRGDTEYSINWIPLGGFVKIKGESGQHRGDADSFASKPAWKRLAVLIAGVTMNLVLASVLLSIGFMIGLPTAIDANMPAGATVEEARMRVMTVADGSPAARAGIVAGEELLSMDGMTFESAEDARAYIQENGDEGIEAVVAKADGAFVTVTVVSEDLANLDVHGVGVGLVKTGLVSFPFHLAVYHGVTATIAYTIEVVRAFADLLRNLVVHQKVSVDLSGPVGIAVMTGEAAQLGITYLLQFAALLSINLAVVNVLPFPALDGGRILFLAIEAVRRKAVDQRLEAIVHNVGFAMLMTLVVLVTYRDFVKFGGQMWGAVKAMIGV